MELKKSLDSFYHLTLKIVLTVVIYISIPMYISLFLLMFSLRKMVSWLSLILRPDLDKMLTGVSSILATDDITTNPKCSLLLQAQFKKPFDDETIEIFKSKWVNKVIGVQNERGELRNIELKQFPHKWMGFTFWKWDNDFDISNHVKCYNHEANSNFKLSLEEIEEIKQKLLIKPFEKNRSPWEMIFFLNIEPNSEGIQTVLLFRIHHSIADGYSAMKLVCFDILDEVPKTFVPKKEFPKLNIFQSALFCLKFLKMPYEVVECFVEAFDRNEWKVPDSERSENWISAVSEKISLDVVKEVTTSLNSDLTAMIFAAFTTAMRLAMLKKSGVVPKYIHIATPFPMKGHPDKLTNHIGTVFIKLPVGENDPMKRLKDIEKTFDKVKNSTLPLTSFLVAGYIGSLFHWMIRPVCKNVTFGFTTAFGSSFPGPKTQLTLYGRELVDCQFEVGPIHGNFGLMLVTFTYNNSLSIALKVNEKILDTKHEVEEITQNCLNEFLILRKFSKRDCVGSHCNT